jgi:hypothetical protein
MCRIKYSILASVVTFMMGVALASINMALRVPELEQTPCNACAHIYERSQIPSVTICELNERREYYRGRLVRISVVFHNDAGQVRLRDHCTGFLDSHSGFGDSFESCAGVRDALLIHTGYGRLWYDGAARVVMVGRAGRVENPTSAHDENGFNIDCIESVEPMHPDSHNMIRYRLSELAGYFLRL